MSDFSDALQARLSANADLAAQRSDAEAKMDQARMAAEEAVRARSQAQTDRHAELSAHLKAVADQLKASRPDSYIVRTGWTDSGEEFIAKLTTRQISPKRSLFIEVDRDDDKVLVRWTSEIGNAIEIWRLLEMTTEMITDMVLQVADDHAWNGRRPPAFPSGPGQSPQA